MHIICKQLNTSFLPQLDVIYCVQTCVLLFTNFIISLNSYKTTNRFSLFVIRVGHGQSEFKPVGLKQYGLHLVKYTRSSHQEKQQCRRWSQSKACRAICQHYNVTGTTTCKM